MAVYVVVWSFSSVGFSIIFSCRSPFSAFVSVNLFLLSFVFSSLLISGFSIAFSIF